MYFFMVGQQEIPQPESTAKANVEFLEYLITTPVGSRLDIPRSNLHYCQQKSNCLTDESDRHVFLIDTSHFRHEHFQNPENLLCFVQDRFRFSWYLPSNAPASCQEFTISDPRFIGWCGLILISPYETDKSWFDVVDVVINLDKIGPTLAQWEFFLRISGAPMAAPSSLEELALWLRWADQQPAGQGTASSTCDTYVMSFGVDIIRLGWWRILAGNPYISLYFMVKTRKNRGFRLRCSLNQSSEDIIGIPWACECHLKMQIRPPVWQLAENTPPWIPHEALKKSLRMLYNKESKDIQNPNLSATYCNTQRKYARHHIKSSFPGGCVSNLKG